MPGLFGIAQRRPSPALEVDYHRLVGNSNDGLHRESLIVAAGRAIAGRTHLGILHPEPQLRRDDAVHVMLLGDVYNVGAIAHELGLESSVTPTRVIATLYERQGVTALARLEGAYGAVVMDSGKRRTLLVSDHIASYPIYWTRTANEFVFGSELAGVLRHPRVHRELDPAAVADYLTFGFPMGTRTLASGVSLVPAGSSVSFDWDSGQTTTTRLDNIVEAFTPWAGTQSDYLEALTSAFTKSVDRAVSGPHCFGVSLSGGLDSRAILSALNGKAPETTTYTLGVHGCADQVIAEQLSRIAGTKHSFFELNDKYLREFLPNQRRMVSLTDGMYLSHGLTEILAVDFIAKAGFSVLVRGHGGELAKTDLAWPLHTDDAIRAMTSRQDFLTYIHRRVNAISGFGSLDDLFTDSWAPALAGGGRASLDSATADVPLDPADLCSYLYLTEHHRRFTTPSIELFRHAVDVRMPFVDKEFLGVLLRGRPEWRADTTIHKRLTAAGNAAMLRVRNSNTGAPADAGPTLEFAFDKINSILKRLGVYGYRHYHTFDRWMRKQLISSVEEVLLSPTSLERGILRESALRRVLTETRDGRADYSYLLQVLLILELWQQENL